jgi:hypothetical protein
MQLMGTIKMRSLLLVGALALTGVAEGHSISDEFAAGFGGVAWGATFDDLIRQFPGGYQVFSTHSGGLAYVINIEDPVLGMRRAGLYVAYAMNPDRLVDGIQIQIPYDQAQQLISTISSKFGPAIGPKVHGVVSEYHWPIDQGLMLSVRFSSGGRTGLAALEIAKPLAKRAASGAPKPKT